MGVVRSVARSATTIDTVSWTAITAPIHGNRVVLTPRAGTAAVKFRTNDGSAATEFTVNAGIQKMYDMPSSDGRPFGFTSDETVIYAQAVSGTGPVDADWS
jgi:hypothetical protein